MTQDVFRIVGEYFGIKYDLDTSDKATLLIGNSATGKTFLYNLFSEHLSHKYKVLTVNNAAAFHSINLYSEGFFIFIDRLDTWCNDSIHWEMTKAISSSHNKFIIVSRYWGFCLSKVKEVIFENDTLQFRAPAWY